MSAAKTVLTKMGVDTFVLFNIHYITKGIGHSLLMKGLTTLVISMSTNLNV